MLCTIIACIIIAIIAAVVIISIGAVDKKRQLEVIDSWSVLVK
jgi:hypothetical protein